MLPACLPVSVSHEAYLKLRLLKAVAAPCSPYGMCRIVDSLGVHLHIWCLCDTAVHKYCYKG